MSARDLRTIIVTGGTGFIGSAVVRHLIAEAEDLVANVDKLTDACGLNSLAPVADDTRYRFEHVDICDTEAVRQVMEPSRPDVLLQLAAQSQENLVPTFKILIIARTS